MELKIDDDVKEVVQLKEPGNGELKLGERWVVPSILITKIV